MRILMVFGSPSAQDWWLHYGPYSTAHAVLQVQTRSVHFGDTIVETAVVRTDMELYECKRGRFFDLVVEHASFDLVLRQKESLASAWNDHVRTRLLDR